MLRSLVAGGFSAAGAIIQQPVLRIQQPGLRILETGCRDTGIQGYRDTGYRIQYVLAAWGPEGAGG